MFIELGHMCLLIAFAMAIFQAFVPLYGYFRNNQTLMSAAPRFAFGQATFLILACASLLHGLVGNDFSVEYIARHSHTAMPLMYRVSALWGGHEGSLLLWATLLSFWMVAVSLGSRQIPQVRYALVHSVMGFVACGFLSFMLFTSNPFLRLLPAALEGAELNPLLQDPALAIHPPMLYMGYVGFSIAFCFAVAALIDGKVDDEWTTWVRPWTLAAWSFLTIGITLGSWWAYYELGWGGWWFWDPVENASFMPWLAGTALIHSLAVSDNRGGFRHWSVLLAILAFSLSLLGTFLVRSGVLTSVHAFATDPARGVFILVFLGFVVGVALSLYAWRAERLATDIQFKPLSRESGMLLNNALVIAALGTVMLGTLYPLVLDALGLGKISVGPPYFERVFVPLMLVVMLFLGVGPFLSWRSTPLARLRNRLPWVFVLACGCGIVGPLFFDEWRIAAAIGFTLSAWVVFATALAGFMLIRSGARFGADDMPRWGMLIAHLGVGLFAFGVTASSIYSEEIETRMLVGESITLKGSELRFVAMREVQGPNYLASEGEFHVTEDGHLPIVLRTQKRHYPTSNRVMTEAAIDAQMTRHLYLAIGEPVNGAWGVRAYFKPFVEFIWLGAFIIALGGAFATFGRRLLAIVQSAKVQSRSAPVSDSAMELAT